MTRPEYRKPQPMLTLHSTTSLPPKRTVIMGAGGFVGRAVSGRLRSQGGLVTDLTRNEVNLLAPDGAARLAQMLSSETTLVVTSALAPCRNAAMLVDTVEEAERWIEAGVRLIAYSSDVAVLRSSYATVAARLKSSPGKP